MARFNALRDALEDDTVSDEALDFVADPYADPTTRLLRSGRASPEVEAFLARQNEIQYRKNAERAVKTASSRPPVKAKEDVAQEDVAQEGVPSFLRPSDWVTARPASLGPSQPKTNGEPVGSPGVVPVPPPELNLAPQLGTLYRSVDESTLSPVGIRLPVKAGPMMTAPSAPSAPVVSKDKAPVAKAPEAQSIPVANAPLGSDAAAPVASTLPATTEKQPAGKPNSDSTPNLPAPSSEGAGSDASERDLYLARLIAQNAAGFGGMGAGKNIDMGIADTLGERLKQVQALRAKREEQSLEQQRERSTWGTSNRATLASALGQWKGDSEKTAALEALASGADTTKPSDFTRNAVNAVMTKPKVLGAEAGVEKTKATTSLTNARIPEVKLEGNSKRALRQAQIDKLRRETAANAVGLTRSAKAVEKAGKEKVTSKDAIKYIRDDIKTAEKAITPTLENFKNIERASPGFAFGKPDNSVATMDFVAAEKLPVFANKARDLRSAVEALIVDIRHGSFGASLTSSEKASFETMLNTGLTGTVEQLSRAINMVRQKAAATAQTHFNTSMTFYPTETSQVLSGSAVFGPATRDGGVYSDVWRVQATPAAGPSESQIAKLRANPDRASEFDAKFGLGSAAKILGGP